MAGGGFSVTIKAVDQASKTIEQINKKFASVSAPIDRIGKSLNRFADVSGLKATASAFTWMERTAVGAFRGVGQLVDQFSILGSATSIAGLAALTKQWAQFGSQIGFTAHRLNIPSGKLQDLQGAAEMAGGSAESMTSGLEGLQQSLYSARNGSNPQMIYLLKRLGVSLTDAHGNATNLADALPQVEDGLARMTDRTAQAAAAQMIFGGASKDLLPLLIQGAAATAKLEQERRQFREVTEQDITSANRLRQSMTRAQWSVEGFGDAIGTAIGPRISGYLDKWADDVRIMTGFLDAYDEKQALKTAKDALPADKKKRLDDMETHRAISAMAKDPKAATNAALAQDNSFEGWMAWLSNQGAFGSDTSSPPTVAGTSRFRVPRPGGAVTPSEPAQSALPAGPSLDAQRRGAGLPTSINGGTAAGFAAIETAQALPAGLLDSVWNAESGRGKHMVSPVGAKGHFQFMDATAKEYGLDDPFDLGKSANAAGRYFHNLIAHYGGDARKAIAGYNWGEGNLDKDVRKYGADWASHLPKETSGYLAKVAGGAHLDLGDAPVSVASEVPHLLPRAADGAHGSVDAQVTVRVMADGNLRSTATAKATGNVKAAPPQVNTSPIYT